MKGGEMVSKLKQRKLVFRYWNVSLITLQMIMK